MRSPFSLLLAVPDRGIRRWIASLVTASLILGVLVGIAATGATGISGSSSPAFADPPPSDPPTSIVLSSDKSTFTAGSWATLTATTDTDIGDTSSTVTITDETADDTVATCTTGTTCEATVSFNTGGPHTYVATVNDLTSNEVTVGRADWTVTLDSSATTFTVGESVTLTATANQDVGQTDYSYAIYIFDENTDDPVSVCNSGTTCSITSSSLFLSGGPHTYVAEVDPYGTTSTYSSATDVQATSNEVPLSRAAWTVSLTSSETTFNAGDAITMTATANQDVGQTDYNYAIYIYDETSNQSVAFCTTGTTCSITTTNWFYSGGPHTYIAVIADPYIWSYSEATDVQAASNEVTLTRAAWSVTLATSATSFSAGNTFTLTATANQDVGATSGGYFIYIYDETTGEYVQYCTSGTTCSYATTYYSGGPDQYVAEIAAGNYAYTMSELSDIQATSGDVTVSRDAWTVSLTTDRTVFTLAQGFTLTATTNQDLGNTNGSYWTYIVDATTGDIIDYCESGTVCSYSTVFGSGDPQTYVAVVAAGNESRADLTYSTLNDVQQSSNEVTETRAPWTISLSATTYETSPLALTFTAVANQPAGEGPYFIEIIDWTTGEEVGYCNPEERSPTCTDTVWPVADGGGEGDLFVAIVAFWSSTSGPGYDIQAISNGFTASSGSGAILSGESVGGSNPSENAPCGCSHGDPINTETGEFYLNATDLGIPGVGPALSVGRTYSSSLAGSDGPFGNGWSASFNAQLTTPVLGDADDPLPRQVRITQENGSTVDFYETPDQTYTAANRVLATLTNDPVSGDWTFTRRQTEVMVFNPTGQLIELQDLHGNTVSLSYNSSNQLDLISASGGRSITLTWTENHVTNATDSAGRSVTYTYDDNSNLISVEAADSSITAYGYDSNHRLTTVVKPDDGITTNTYDSSGRVVSQTDPLDRETTFSYSDGGTTTTTTDPSGAETVEVYNNGLLVSSTKAASTDDAETTTYAYDSAANLASVTDPLGKVTSYTYDANGNILTQTDPLDRTTTWTYDGLNDVTSVTDPMSREASATYDTAGDKLTSTSPGGHVQHWTYNMDGTVATFEDARGHTTTYGYNSAGDQTSVTDPDDRTTSTAYDDAGIVTSTTDPGGNETTYTTDTAGRVLTVTDPNDHTTTYTYDGDGNRTSVENAGDHTTTYVYDAADELTSSTVPGDHTTTYTYTDAGLPATTTDPNGHTTTTAYNALGLVTSVTNPDGKVTTYGYDGDGRQTSVTLPSGDESTETYDDAGQEMSSTDAAGKTTTYAYNDDGELTSTTDPLDRVTTETYTADAQLQTVTLPDSSTETSTYNADGQVTDFENPDGQHTTYSYDNAGLLTSKTEPGSVTTSYTYNTAGLLHVTTNPDSSTVTDSYNPGGLLTGVAYSASSGADVSYSYDADNLRTGMTDATGTSSYSYNSRGLMTSETNGAGATIGYGYDAASQLTSITYPGDNTVTYGYDDAGQMTSLTDSASNETDFTWTDDGQLATQADPNGITQTRTYDADDRTTGISTADGDSTVADYTYGYDDDSELTADSTIDPNNSTALTHTYSYDSDSQLTTVDNGTTSPSYANTPGGEITTNTAGSTLAYNSADELVSVTPGAGPSTTYAYDDNGDRTSSTVGATETTSASTTSYGYDPAGNLASVAIPATGSSDAVTVDYTSDGDGLRESRTVGTTTTDFLWDTNASVPLLLDDGTYSYLYGPSSAPIAEVNDSTGTIRYLTSDLIGSTRLITSSSGSVVGVNIYDEYGNLETHTGTATSPIGYSGNWTDPDTGLVYLRARDYDPVTAQFLTVDPLVDTTRQPYAYVADNPLTQTDPSGCDFWNDLLNNVAVGLMHGPGADVASVLEGIGDGASFGLTDQVRQLMGTDCEVQKNGFYFAGLIGGAIASTVVTAGIGSEGDVADAGEAFEDGAGDLGTTGDDASGAGAEEDSDAGDVCDMAAAQSFAPETKIVLADGKTLPIDRVKVGDKVKSVDTNTGKSVIRAVTAVWIDHDNDLMNVTIVNAHGDKSTIHTTQHHPFWDLTSHSWVDADNLQPGDRLEAADGEIVKFSGAADVTGEASMWDLSVAGVHDFYVSAGWETVLVHNDGCTTDASGALRQFVAKQAGFNGSGPKLIVDENLPASFASGLRTVGYDARSVGEMGLNGASDEALNTLADQVGAKVLTRDVGHDLAGGFGQNAIVLDSRIRTISSVLRVLGG